MSEGHECATFEWSYSRRVPSATSSGACTHESCRTFPTCPTFPPFRIASPFGIDFSILDTHSTCFVGLGLRRTKAQDATTHHPPIPFTPNHTSALALITIDILYFSLLRGQTVALVLLCFLGSQDLFPGAGSCIQGGGGLWGIGTDTRTPWHSRWVAHEQMCSHRRREAAPLGSVRGTLASGEEVQGLGVRGLDTWQREKSLRRWSSVWV
jgi:hypothetical protein